MSDSYEFFNYEIDVDTEKAVMLTIPDICESEWFPKSRVKFNAAKSGSPYVEIPEWLLKKKGLIE